MQFEELRQLVGKCFASSDMFVLKARKMPFRKFVYLGLIFLYNFVKGNDRMLLSYCHFNGTKFWPPLSFPDQSQDLVSKGGL